MCCGGWRRAAAAGARIAVVRRMTRRKRLVPGPARVHRGLNETAEVEMKGGKGLLPVSRGFVHLFRQT